MMRRGVGGWVRLLAVLVALVVGLPTPARAHGIGGRLDLAVPVTYFVVGAGIVVILSFALLAVLWPRPRLQDGPRRRPLPSVALSPVYRLAQALGMLGLALVVGAGAAAAIGRDIPGPSIAPVTVWVVFWLILPFASVVLGDIYTAANPWRTLADLFRIGRAERPALLTRWGVWPATAMFGLFAWFELISPDSGSASALGLGAGIYTVLMLGAIAVMGKETALASLDLFTVYNRLFSAISPFGRSDGRLRWRGWGRALVVVPEWRGLWAFVAVAIGTVSYDGLSATSWWPDFTMLGETLAMATVAAIVAFAYLGASAVADRMTGQRSSAIAVAQRFAHTLVPIGVAYAFAHYFTLVIFEGQQVLSAVSDPFGVGWDLFGTASRKVDFFIRRPEPIWYIQVAAIVTGHVAAVVLAHDRALAEFSGPEAVRSQYAMLILMVLLTGLGLVILAG